MQRRMDISAQGDERTAKRTRTARKWAGRLKIVLMCLVLSAIWQDKRLAPPVHDGMQHVAAAAMAYVEDSEALSEALAELQKSYDELTSDS